MDNNINVKSDKDSILLNISHLPTEADVMQTQKLLAKSKIPSNNKLMLRIIGILLCVLSVPAVLAMSNYSSFAAFLVLDVLVISGILLFFYYDWFRLLSAKSRAKRAFTNSSIVSRTTRIILTDECINIESGDSRSNYPIKSAVTVINSGDCYVLDFGCGAVYQIPKRLLTAEQIDDASDLFKKLCGEVYTEI